MTEIEAYKVLGTSSSVGRSRTELLYQQKCRKLRLQMMPGMPAEVRQRAQAELAPVNAAWQIIRAASPAKIPTTKPAWKPTTGPSTANVTSCRRPQIPGPAWAPAASEMPFSSPVMVIAAIAVLVLIVIALLTRS
jgi:hypothetical protein